MTHPAVRSPAATHRYRLAATLALAIVAGAAVPMLITTPAAASGTLRAHAAARGKFIGYAAATTGSNPLANEAAYRTIAATEFNQVTAENAMKWDATEPSDNNYTFTGADQVVAFAQQNNQVVHGHTLVWHSQTPSWVQGLNATAMRTAMQDHISTVVGRYANNPIVQSWDVVNEVFEENGSLRASFWLNTLGQSYIADAFRFARAADPDARLCINDFNVEGVNAKSTAMFNLVQSLRSQGVPVDCVGFQAHLGIQFGFPSQVLQNVQRFASLGVQVRFTEVDIRMVLPRDSTKDAQQATFYANIVNACLEVQQCAGITIWGFTDKYSWVPSTFSGQGAALIYDENYNPKPAYTAVHNALAGSTSPPPADTTPPSVPGTPSVSGVTSTGASLSWAASTDNVGVAGYNVHREQGATDPLLAQPGANSVTLTGLTPATQYQVYVRARDAAGNLSGNSGLATFTTLPSGGGGGGCRVRYVASDWGGGGGFTSDVTITNTGATAVNGWSLVFTFGAGQRVTQMWNATYTQPAATVTATNMPYNAVIGANGGSVNFGFNGTFSGSNPNPGGFALNGTACGTG